MTVSEIAHKKGETHDVYIISVQPGTNGCVQIDLNNKQVCYTNRLDGWNGSVKKGWDLDIVSDDGGLVDLLRTRIRTATAEIKKTLNKAIGQESRKEVAPVEGKSYARLAEGGVSELFTHGKMVVTPPSYLVVNPLKDTCIMQFNDNSIESRKENAFISPLKVIGQKQMFGSGSTMPSVVLMQPVYKVSDGERDWINVVHEGLFKTIMLDIKRALED